MCERSEIAPREAAMLVASLGFTDSEELEKQLEAAGVGVNGPMKPVLKAELLLESFCLFAIRARSQFSEEEVKRLFVAMLLKELQRIRVEGAEEDSRFARELFSNDALCNRSWDAYVNHRFSPPLERNVFRCRGLFDADETNALHFHSAIIHSQLMAFFGIEDVLVWMNVFLAIAAMTNEKWKLYKKWIPVLDSSTAGNQ